MIQQQRSGRPGAVQIKILAAGDKFHFDTIDVMASSGTHLVAAAVDGIGQVRIKLNCDMRVTTWAYADTWVFKV